MSYSELFVALENNIIDTVATVPTVVGRRADTSAPVEIAMAAKDDRESAREEEDRRIVDFALQAVYKGTGKGKWSFKDGQNWKGKGYHGDKVGMAQGQRGKKGGKVQEKGGKGEGRTCWTCGKAGHIAAWCRKGDNKNLLAIDEDSEHIEEAHDSEGDLQAWCLLEERWNGKRWSANGKNKR